MKLPKQFGGAGNFAQTLQQAQEAMARAQNIEAELEKETFEISKNGVAATFNGTGALLKMSLDKDLVDPDDVETLEDLIVSTIRDGFAKATEIREARVKEIMPNVPGLGGLLGG